MMTLSEAISHAEWSSVAHATTDPLLAEEMNQIAEWLGELRDRRRRDEIALGLAPVPSQVAAVSHNERLEQEREATRRTRREKSLKDNLASLASRNSRNPADDWRCVFLFKKAGVDAHAVAEQMRAMPGVRSTFVHSPWQIDDGMYCGVEAHFHRDAVEPLCRITVVGCEGRIHFWTGL